MEARTLGTGELGGKQDVKWEGVGRFRWGEPAGSKGEGLKQVRKAMGSDTRGGGRGGVGEPHEHSGPPVRPSADSQRVFPICRTALPTDDSGFHLV